MRVHLAVTPKVTGRIDLAAVRVTYRAARWLPSRTVEVFSMCFMDVVGVGRDPNIT